MDVRVCADISFDASAASALATLDPRFPAVGSTDPDRFTVALVDEVVGEHIANAFAADVARAALVGEVHGTFDIKSSGPSSREVQVRFAGRSHVSASERRDGVEVVADRRVAPGSPSDRSELVPLVDWELCDALVAGEDPHGLLDRLSEEYVRCTATALGHVVPRPLTSRLWLADWAWVCSGAPLAGFVPMGDVLLALPLRAALLERDDLNEAMFVRCVADILERVRTAHHRARGSAAHGAELFDLVDLLEQTLLRHPPTSEVAAMFANERVDQHAPELEVVMPVFARHMQSADVEALPAWACVSMVDRFVSDAAAREVFCGLARDATVPAADLAVSATALVSSRT